MDKDTEIKTEGASRCYIYFDDKFDNTLELSEESHMGIVRLNPPGIYLKRGEIFFFKEDIGTKEEFKIKTAFACIETNMAGAVISAAKEEIIVKCFEGMVKVETTGKGGSVIATRSLEEGFGVKVNGSSKFGDTFELNDYDIARWDEASDNIGHIRANMSSNEIRQP